MALPSTRPLTGAQAVIFSSAPFTAVFPAVLAAVGEAAFAAVGHPGRPGADDAGAVN